MSTKGSRPILDPHTSDGSRRTRSFLGLFALTLACLLALLGYFLWASHRQAEEAAEITTRNLVQVIESRLHGDLERAAGLLDFMAREMRPAQLQRQAVAENRVVLSERMASLLMKFPAVSVTNFFDAQGDLLYSSSPATGQFNIADRPFFKPLRDDPKAGLIFSDVQMSRSTGHRALVLIQAIRDGAGQFMGSVAAVINLDPYLGLFSGIDVGSGGVTLIRRSDNFNLVLRYPAGAETDVNNSLPIDNPIRQRIAGGDASGTLAYTASFAGVERIASFRKLEGYPFYVQVALAKTDYLSAWRIQAAIAGTLTIFVIAIFWLAMVRTARADARVGALSQRLIYREALFSGMFEQSNFLAGVLDKTGHVLEANESALAVIGGRRDQALGYYFPDTPWFFRAEDKTAVAQLLRSAAAGQRGSIEIQHPMAGGGTMNVLFHAIPVQAGSELLIAAIGVDISDRKKAEAELLRSNRELEQFSYSISHDMRQPLRMISSYLQLLEKSLADRLDEESREYFHFAIDGAKRLDAMLLGLLEYSRIGRKGEPPVWLDSRTIVDEALLFLQPAIAESEAKITLSGDWPRIPASPDEMLRLVQNLIDNAIKFRVAGRRPEITLSSEIVAGHWRLAITDNGIGILPDQIGRLFQVFQRLQLRSAYEGTGIGLALCRKIAEHHHGRIWASSEGEGNGSTFFFEMPLDLASPMNTASGSL